MGPFPPAPAITGQPLLRRPRRLATFLLLSVGAVFASAGTAHAATPGLNLKDYGDARVALAQGAKQVRFFVRWSDFEPSSSTEFSASGGARAGEPIPAGLRAGVDLVLQQGATPIMAVLGAPAWAASGKRPRDANEYATFTGELAGWLAQVREQGQPSPAYEIWNEPDAPEFWGEAPNADFYTAMLRASYQQVKRNDQGATVLTGPTTGNNYDWIQSLYARGAKGAFDGVSVHTDTACSDRGPDSFYRDASGRLGQFTFLGYREVRATMLANGDDKPIWMTELGWSTTNGGPTSCARGEQAGKKPSGVNEANQAAFLRKAFECLALDPYVVAATVFTLRDDPTNGVGSELSHYGLLRADGASKPSADVFRGAGGIGPGACGDFEPPSVNVTKPAEGEVFVDRLELAASASDSGVGLGRITYTFDGGQQIRNFTEQLSNGASVGLSPWFGSRELGVGPHRIEVTALDTNGNVAQKVVNVVKAPLTGDGALPQTVTPKYRISRKISCGKSRKGVRACSSTGRLVRPSGGARIGGKLAVEWQFRNKKGQYRKLVGGLKSAGKSFTFKAKLKNRGKWRVRVAYEGQAPYKATRSEFLYFRYSAKGAKTETRNRYSLRGVSCGSRTDGKRSCSVKATLVRPTGSLRASTVTVRWQQLVAKRYRTRVTDEVKAGRSVKLPADLEQAGRWRVRATYRGAAPYDAINSSYRSFRVE